MHAAQLPLHFAVAAGAPIEVIDLLLRAHPAGAQEVYATRGLEPPGLAIHLALVNGASSAVMLRLLTANPNAVQMAEHKGNNRWPLHWAIQHELFDVAMGLLERGDDPLAVDSAGRTALDIATGSPSTQLQSWARNFGTFLGRYRFQRGRVAHQSSSSTVIFATDIERDDRGVAMKFMAHEEQYEREVAMRQLPPAVDDGDLNNGTVDGEYVTQVLHHARLDLRCF